MCESQEGVIMVVIYTRGFRDLISLCYAERSGYLLVVSSAENISPLGILLLVSCCTSRHR
jgi:hypothetical protein